MVQTTKGGRAGSREVSIAMAPTPAPTTRSAKGAHDAHAARVAVAPRRMWLEETVDGGKV